MAEINSDHQIYLQVDLMDRVRLYRLQRIVTAAFIALGVPSYTVFGEPFHGTSLTVLDNHYSDSDT
jgi:hypothetical protein